MDRVLDVTVDPTPDAHGDLAGEAHIIGDITDITCTTEALQSSKAYLQAVLDSVGDALFVDDADTGQIIDVNRRCCEMYGYSHEEMLRTPIGALSQGRPPYSQAEALEWRRKTREEGPQVFEWLAKRKNGDLLWVEVSTRHVVIDGTHRFVVAVRDINERKEVLEALRLSEERRRLAMAVANDGLWDWDLTTNDVYFDPRYYLMAGYEVDEFPHRLEEFQTRTHPDDLGYVMAEAEKHLRGESDRFEVEFRFRTRSGDYMWILGMGQIVARDEQGRPMRFVGTHSDITTRMEMEEQLRRTNAFLDSIIENIPDMIFIKDAKELRFVRFNRAGEELLGQSREGLLGKNDYDFFPLEQADHFVSIDRRVLQGKTVVDIPDEAIETSRKGRRILHTKKVPVLNEQGEPDYLLGISEDITERRQAEEDLRRAEERFRAIALNTPDHIIIQDRELRYVFVVNHQLGLTDEDMIGKTDRELTGIAADDTEKLTAVKMKVLETGNPYHFEASITNLEGKPEYFEGVYTPKFDVDGKVDGLIGYFRNVTERRQAEEEREKLQAQLAQVQKLESLGRLAGGVAHDFNNMLGVILGHVELAKEDTGPHELLRADLDEIEKAARRSADLTRQLLAFARKQTVAPKVVDLNQTVESMLAMLTRLIGEDIDLVWRPGCGIRPVFIDPAQVGQILVNLCVNSRDAIAGVGTITIETGNVTFDEVYCAGRTGVEPGEFVLLSVADDGCGMDAETQSHLFEPFFTTKPMGKGTGLGLATVHGVVTQNNGFIDGYTEVGRGTTFKVYLPSHHGAQADVGSDVQSAPVSASHSETILVVEDEPAILSLITRMLEDMGYAVIAAVGPREAIRLAREHRGRIHLLMTDVVMPEMNGRDLAANLMSILPDLRCLFTSGYTADVIAHHGVLDEGMHFLEKPFSKNDLAAKIREALGPV